MVGTLAVDIGAPRANAAPAYGYTGPSTPETPDIPAVSALMTSAIAARHLPGAVVMIGHRGQPALLRAYGVRKPAGEPGVDGVATPAEPMTTDTVFDVASLTKVLATATAVMQLHEQGRVRLDDPVQTYLPAFNPAHDPHRTAVTVRTLLTHTSGLPGDVNLDDPWGLVRADRSEGMRRALTAPLEMPPGTVFRYSDINFELLGALIEAVTGEPENVYVRQNIFAPLGMTDTRYLPSAGPVARNRALLSRIAPTRLDTEGRPWTNPHFGTVMRGVVDDPTSRRMGGVAGHAGVFSTAADIGLFAQALLDRLAGRPSAFPLRRETLQTMTAPNRPSVPGPVHAVRGLGWDIDTGYSGSRGSLFPVGSFGHTGFTGTSLWIDPASDTYVVVLSNAVHTPGSPPIARLAGAVATAAARAMGIGPPPAGL
ncbi:serine hydrolase domain-containing protein [Mycobacterium kyogaense]|uniref:serine hydrolase domain-containing protein n=1 Tax=Mycobacterium kyogaense TaxID=2212479 RepID=UPI003FA53E7B